MDQEKKDEQDQNGILGTKPRALGLFEERMEKRRRRASISRLIFYVVMLIVVILLMVWLRRGGI